MSINWRSEPIKDNDEKALDCHDAIEELKVSVQSLYEEAFDNIVDEYDNIISQIEHKQDILEGYIDQTEAKGYIVSTKYYNALIKNEAQNLEKLNKKRADLIASLNDALSNGDIKMYSSAWFDMQNEINDCNQAIQEANTSMIEYGNSIREIKWDVFDKLQDSISSITSESDFLIELMSNSKLFEDNGKITGQGKSSMALHGINYNTYMSQADDYRKEMEALQSEIQKDPYNQELIERRKELLELQQKSILAAEDEKQAIKDLVEDGIKKQLDSLKDLIDKYTDAMDSQKDLHDYQKEIANKQKEIASIQKQISAWSGDTSEEGAANRQKLQTNLDEAMSDLEDTQYDRSISEQKKLLDELYNEYELVLNMRLDNIDMLIADVISNVNADSSSIRDTIIAEANDVGYKLTESMNTILGGNGTIASILTIYSNNFSSTMTSVQQAINDIRNYIRDAVGASDNTASNDIDTSNQSQAEQTTPPPTPQPAPQPEPVSQDGGDGVPKIGDKVTYVSGNYYYDSYGTRPLGHHKRGEEVYITYMNPGAPYPIGISSTPTPGKGDLGWLKLEQLKGYKKGIKKVPTDQMARVCEDGKDETIITDGEILVPLHHGDTVLNNKAHENIWDMANNPTDYIAKNMVPMKMNLISSFPEFTKPANQSIKNDVNLQISIDKVMDYNDFVTKLQKDPKFEQLVQTMTLGQALGKGSLNKHSIRF